MGTISNYHVRTMLVKLLVIAGLTCSVLFVSTSQSTDGPRVVYSDHCASLVPESVPTEHRPSVPPLAGYHRGYYVDDEEEQRGFSRSSVPAPNGIRFTTLHVHQTEREGVLNVKAEVFTWLQSLNYLRDEDFGQKTSVHEKFPPGSRVVFWMEGFWSESSGRLCMVGSTSSKRRDLVDLKAVLKLNNVSRSANITSLFTGTLTSLNSPDDKGHFGELRILIFPMMNYNYVLDHGGESSGGGSDLPLGLSPGENMFCPLLRRIGREFLMKYDPHCDKASGCEIFKGSAGFLPHLMLLDEISCSEGERKLRILLSFVNTSFENFHWHFGVNRMLVGEGRWNEATNRLNIVACRLTTQGSMHAVRAEDCNTNLEILFPAVWSIRKSNSMIGRIWRTKTQDDPGYYRKTLLRSGHSRFSDFPDLRYEYTEAERVRKLCPTVIAEKEKKMYPYRSSPDLRFQMKVMNSQGRVAYGHFDPLFFGDQIFHLNAISSDRSSWQARDRGFMDEGDAFAVESGLISGSYGRFNISYSLGFPRQITEESGDVDGIIRPTWAADELEITAEGVYDMNTGALCMVGCRSMASISRTNIWEDDFLDCEILVRIRFPPVNLARRGNYIDGTIESTRAQSDPLYFGTLNVSSNMLYIEDAREFIWRTDVEFLLTLASNTFTGLFVVRQIWYVKRNPKVIQVTSLFMLAILTLGHVIPLVFAVREWFVEHDILQDILLKSSRLLRPSEAIVTMVTTFASLLQLRLLQLHWFAKVTRMTEKKLLVILLPLYATGALLAMVRSWGTTPIPIHVGLKYYAGVVQDGFLVPQILLNVLADSRQRVLSRYFYVGLSVIRLLPHAYDIHRARHYYPSERFQEYYMINTPELDLSYKSIAGEITISLGILALAVIVHCQQRFGGSCVTPERFRNHESMPITADEELDWT